MYPYVHVFHSFDRVWTSVYVNLYSMTPNEQDRAGRILSLLLLLAILSISVLLNSDTIAICTRVNLYLSKLILWEDKQLKKEGAE